MSCQSGLKKLRVVLLSVKKQLWSMNKLQVVIVIIGMISSEMQFKLKDDCVF